MVSEKVQVLIVGGGGAGLTASMLLARMGIDCVLVNSLSGTSELPKAHVLNQRAMEIMNDCGTADDIYEVGTPPHQLSHTAFYAGFAGHHDAGTVMYKQESWGAGGVDDQWRMASPMTTTNLPQIRLEPILRRHAETLSPGKVRFHHEVVDVSQNSEKVIVTVMNHDTAESYEVAADYLLACDGGRTIGRRVGVELEGLRDLTRTTSVYATCDLSQWATDDDVLLRWVWSPYTGRMVVMAPMGPTRWGPHSEEWVFHISYPIDDQRAFDDDAVITDVRESLGLGDHPITVHTVTRWTIGGVVANSFRQGRVFVAGDAAHRHPPTGALGLTSAMHDVHNLCWKLAAVLRGQAGDSLLDTYEHERRPVDARNVARSLENSAGYTRINRALGIGDPNMSFDERWRVLSRMWSGSPDDEQFRRSVLELMAAQSQEFREHDVEYGYSHASDAVVGDVTRPRTDAEFRMYIPSTRPGSPLPHAWIEDWNFTRCSTLDLVEVDSFLVIAGEDGHEWYEAARAVGEEYGVKIRAVTIGHSRGDFRDPRLMWQHVRGISPTGAILVRPDRCVAFRSLDEGDSEHAELSDAMRRILARPR